MTEAIQPLSEIAYHWAQEVVTRIETSIHEHKTYITLSSMFGGTSYEILTWPQLLDISLNIYENQEEYEFCESVVSIKQKLEQRIDTFKAQQIADTVRG